MRKTDVSLESLMIKQTTSSINEISVISLLTVSGAGYSRYLIKSVILLFLISGSLLQVVIYDTSQPLVVGIIFFFAGIGILRFSAIGGLFERRAFQLVFSICWFWAGVAASYSVYFNDPGQNVLDAWRFFCAASQNAAGLSIDEISQMSEGAGAILIWREVYNLFADLGFNKGSYIGVTFNVFLVSMTSVISIKISKCIFGNDNKRQARLIILFSLCGIFWLFASIHLRDSSILFLNTTLMYIGVRFLVMPKMKQALVLVVSFATSTVIYSFLRTEFFFVPIAVLIALVTALMFFGIKGHWPTKLLICVILIVGGLAVAYFSKPSGGLMDSFIRGNQLYAEKSNTDADANSLGSVFLVNQPLLLRIPIGSFFMQVSPIPFWVGFQAQYAYRLFKSLNAVFMWFVLPLSILGARRVLQINERNKSSSLMFLLFVYAGFTVAIAVTSLEGRHLGSFLVPLLVLATVPDLKLKRDSVAYMNLLAAWLLVAIFIHILWAALKFV